MIELAHRLLVPGYLTVGVAFSAGILALLLVLWARRAAPASAAPLPARGSRFGQRRALIAGLAVGALILASRLALMPSMFDPFLFQDEAFVSCIVPLQDKLGLPRWNNDSSRLYHSLSRLVLETAGFRPAALRASCAAAFALATGFLVYRLRRRDETWWPLFLGLLLAVSYPFVMHSTWATVISFAALPTLVLFALVLPAERIGYATAAAAGVLASASLYVYPAATLACASFLALHVLFFRRRWRAGPVALAAIAGLATKAALDLAYGEPFLRGAYGGGSFSTAYLEEGLRVVAQDLFYRSTSFNSLNLGGPFFEPPLLWLLPLALMARSRPFLFAAAVLALNIVLAGFTGPYPGIRRALWSLPLLYWGCAEGARLLAARRPRLAPWLVAAGVASLLTVGARTAVIAATAFPVYWSNGLYDRAAAFLGERAPLDVPVVLLENPHHEFGSRDLWCALGFTKGLWRAGEAPRLVSKQQPLATPRAEEYWVLLQPGDTASDVERVFGKHAAELLHPDAPDVWPAQEPVAAGVLRVLRVLPAPAPESLDAAAVEQGAPE